MENGDLWGLEGWLSGQEHMLLLQKTCNASFRVIRSLCLSRTLALTCTMCAANRACWKKRSQSTPRSTIKGVSCLLNWAPVHLGRRNQDFETLF